MSFIQSRLVFATNTARITTLGLRSVKEDTSINEASGVIYLRPPVADVGTLEFGRFEEVLERGLLYGRQQVERWREDGTIARLVGGDKGTVIKG